MKVIGLTEARYSLSELIAQGEAIVVRRYNKPVAVIFCLKEPSVTVKQLAAADLEDFAQSLTDFIEYFKPFLDL